MENNKKLKLSGNLEIQKKYGLGGDTNSTFSSNIYDQEQTTAKLRSAFEILSNTVGRTLGPYGSTILLEGIDDYPLISKDGKDVFDHIRFDDHVSHLVWSIIKRSVSTQARGVGDGTTSAVVVANKLYQNFQDVLFGEESQSELSKLSPKDITDINEFIVKRLIKELENRAIPVGEDMDEVAKIASVSFNNDKEVGEFIRDIYKKTGVDGYITTFIRPHNHLENEVELIKGFELDGSAPISQEYLTFMDSQNDKIVYNDKPLVFMSNGILTTSLVNSFLNPIITKYCISIGGNKPQDILFIANDYDKGVKEFLMGLRKRLATPYQQGQGASIGSFTPIDFSTIDPEKRLLFEDLAVALGVKVFDPNKETVQDLLANSHRYFGTADRIEVGAYSTRIITPDDEYFISEGKETVVDRKNMLISEIRAGIEDLEKSSIADDEEDRGLIVMKKRLNRLTSYNSAVIDPGGPTLDHRISAERLFEDAILSSKNALKHGYINGGFLTSPIILQDKEFANKLIKDAEEHFTWITHMGLDLNNLIRDFIEILTDSYLEVFRKVLSNANIVDSETVQGIISDSLTGDKFYNVKNRNWIDIENNDIINPVNLDIEILRSISSIVMLLIQTPIVVSKGTNRIESTTRYM